MIISPNDRVKKEEGVDSFDLIFKKNDYTFKMGRFEQYELQFSDGRKFSVFLKFSNKKYFIYSDKEIILFSDIETCVRYFNAK